MAQPIPDGYPGLMPDLAVDDAAAAIDFYQRAFGARERGRMVAPGGKIAHAELELAGSVLMLADPFPGMTAKPPKELGGTTVSVFLYVEDVDAFVRQAVDAGATVRQPVEDMFWGDRFGKLADPFGHEWAVATHVEDLTPEEMTKRSEQAMAQMG